MRRAAKVDGNHVEVVKALRKAGIWVRSTAALGGGFPDLICALRGVLVLLEVKDGSLAPSAQALTAAEQEFHDTCSGPVFVVRSPEEAVMAVVEAARPWDRPLPSEGKDAAELALDDIAAMCGCPEWDYPGQVVRDVSRALEAARPKA